MKRYKFRLIKNCKEHYTQCHVHAAALENCPVNIKFTYGDPSTEAKHLFHPESTFKILSYEFYMKYFDPIYFSPQTPPWSYPIPHPPNFLSLCLLNPFIPICAYGLSLAHSWSTRNNKTNSPLSCCYQLKTALQLRIELCSRILPPLQDFVCFGHVPILWICQNHCEFMYPAESVPKDCLSILIFQLSLFQSFHLTFPMIPGLYKEGCDTDVPPRVEYSERN